jgi:prepilin-type N-terminal cleavage/methylation domain-containing protein
MQPRSVRRARQAVTLVELLVVLGVLGSLAVAGGGLVSGILSYYRTRSAADAVLWSARTTQEFARSRGPTPPAGGSSGVYFFAKQLVKGGGATIDACSILRWGISQVNHPGMTHPTYGQDLMGAITANPLVQAEVIDLDPGTVVTKRNTLLASEVPSPIADGDHLEFGPDGKLVAGSIQQVILTSPGVAQFTVKILGGSAPTLSAQ